MGESNFSFYIFIIIAIISIINKIRKSNMNKKTPEDGLFKKKIKKTTFFNARGQAVGSSEKDVILNSRNERDNALGNNTAKKNPLASKLTDFLNQVLEIPENKPTPISVNTSSNFDYVEKDSNDDVLYDELIEKQDNSNSSDIEFKSTKEYKIIKKRVKKYNVKNILNSKNDMRKAILLAEIVDKKY